MSLANLSSVRPKRFLLPILFAAFTMILLIGLGIWQLQRLSWKEALIVKIGERAKAPISALPAFSDWPNLKPEDYEYRHVAVEGDWVRDKIALVFRGTGGGTGIKAPGYLVFMPLKIKSARSLEQDPVQPTYVMINRGFVPAEDKDLAKTEPASGWTDVRVEGLMRSPEERNFFTPNDKPETGEYFTRDPKLMAEQFGLRNAAPFSIDEDSGALSGEWPKGGTTEIAIPNNHLGYALTWFGLALGCAGVFIAYIRTK